MSNCGRPSKMSASVTFPSGPSNTYCLSISTIGRLRRSMLRASLTRVSSFSFCRSSLRASNHSSREVIRGSVMSSSSVGQERNLHTCVLSQQRRPRYRRGAEPFVKLVQRRVEGVGVVVERKHQLHGALVVEVGDSDADQRQALVVDQWLRAPEQGAHGAQNGFG